jgi:hypothetical protein
MSTVAKILVVLNLVLAAAFMASAAAFLGYQDHWSQKHALLEKEKDRLVNEEKAKVTEATAAVARLTRQAQDADQARVTAEAQAAKDRSQNELLANQVKLTTANLASATRSLEAAQGTIQSNLTLIGTLQEARQKLTEQVGAANDAKDAAVRDTNQTRVALENLQREKEATGTQIDELTKQLQSAQFRLDAMQRSGVGTDVPTEQPPSLSGRILAADNAANVVVISLGDEDKVKAGFRYIVARGDGYVATIEITKVEAKKSAARSLKDLEKSPPRVGDTVIPR